MHRIKSSRSLRKHMQYLETKISLHSIADGIGYLFTYEYASININKHCSTYMTVAGDILVAILTNSIPRCNFNDLLLVVKVTSYDFYACVIKSK